MLMSLKFWEVGPGWDRPGWASRACGQWSRRLGAGLLMSKDKTLSLALSHSKGATLGSSRL